ncbi:MAG TPA: hypothetical protein VJ549_07430, partial [Geothrix sp.]|nr:hypothetical protein [Geothrix sp.]
AADLALLEGHLAECPTCQAAAESLRTSQAWLREALAPPFVPIDHENLRLAVITQLRTEAAAKPVRRLATRPALLAACAVSLLIATLVWRRGPREAVQLFGLEGPPAPKTMAVAPPPDAQPSHAPRETPRLAQPSPRMALTQKAGSPPPAEPARIEFQTADPNIRIIWLARATPLPDTNPSLQEAP